MPPPPRGAVTRSFDGDGLSASRLAAARSAPRLSPPPTPARSEDPEGLKRIESRGAALQNLLQLAEDPLLLLHSRTNGGWKRRSQRSEAVVAPKGAR